MAILDQHTLDPELERLRTLERSGLLDHPEDPALQRLVRLTATVMETPVALISLVDHDRQWFLAKHGLDAKETPRAISFCTHTIDGDSPLVVPDAQQDPRFYNNPLVTTQPHIRFYAGCPLKGENGHKLGALCVIDTNPRKISNSHLQLLEDLREIVNRELDVRHKLALHRNGIAANKPLFCDVLQRELRRAAQDQIPLSLIGLACDHHQEVCGALGVNHTLRWLDSICKICADHTAKADLIGLINQQMLAVVLPGADREAALQTAAAMRMALRGASPAIELPSGRASFSAIALEVGNKQRGAEELLEICEKKLKGLQANLGDQTDSDISH